MFAPTCQWVRGTFTNGYQEAAEADTREVDQAVEAKVDTKEAPEVATEVDKVEDMAEDTAEVKVAKEASVEELVVIACPTWART